MMRSAAPSATKMHGAQNAFVVIDERPPAHADYPALARRVCAPEGAFAGADGLLVLSDATDALVRMRVYNADGSEAEMCGNGVRCVARYLHDRGAGSAFTIATAAGPIGAQIVGERPFAARIDMGPVTFANDASPQILALDGETFRYYDVSVGNPHAVVFVDDVEGIDLARVGEGFNRLYERGVNVHVVEVCDTATLRVRHYERGAGLTRACGTGAVACAATAILTRGANSPVTVHVPGGTLEIDWHPGSHASLTGPAETLFVRPLPQ